MATRPRIFISTDSPIFFYQTVKSGELALTICYGSDGKVVGHLPHQATEHIAMDELTHANHLLDFEITPLDFGRVLAELGE